MPFHGDYVGVRESVTGGGVENEEAPMTGAEKEGKDEENSHALKKKIGTRNMNSKMSRSRPPTPPPKACGALT